MLRYIILALAAGVVTLSAACSSTTNVTPTGLPTRDVSTDIYLPGDGSDVYKAKTASADIYLPGDGSDVYKTPPTTP